MSLGGHIGPNLRVQKVSKIFSKFDADRDGHLNRDEMSALVLAVNPKVSFSKEQMEAILGEVFRNYTDYIDDEKGLTFDGLLQTYDDGAGDIDRDFEELGLELDEENPNHGTSNFPISNPNMNPSSKNNGGEDKGFSNENAIIRTRRKWVISSSAPTMRLPDNGMHFDDSWTSLVEELDSLIRKLEVKKGREGCDGEDIVDGCLPPSKTSSHRGSVNGVSCKNDSGSNVVRCKNNSDPNVVRCENDSDSNAARCENGSDSNVIGCKNDSGSKAVRCKNDSDSNVGSCKKDSDSNAVRCKKDSDSNVVSCKKDSDSNAVRCKKDSDSNVVGCKKDSDSNVVGCKKDSDSNVVGCKKDSDYNVVSCKKDSDSFRCRMGSFDWRPSRGAAIQDSVPFHKGLCEIRKRIDALEVLEDAFDAHMASGRVLLDHRLYKEAMASFTRGKELKPADVRPHFLMGNACYAMKRVLEAKEAYAAALSVGEGDRDRWGGMLPQIHVNLGIVMEAEGMLFGAVEHYKEAAREEPKHYRAWKLLGSAMYGAGEYEEAKDALLEAIALHPGYADAHCELGLVWHALGSHGEAMGEFELALELRKDHVEALYNLGTLYKDMGQYRKAADTYCGVLALQPENWRAELNRAVSLLAAGEMEGAKRAFKEAYRMTGRHELHGAMMHLQHMEEKGSFSFVVAEASCFQRADLRTAPRQQVASALEIRRFQCSTGLDRCDLGALKRLLVAPGPPPLLVRKEALEKLLRSLLSFLKPEAFQGAMRAINEKILSRLDRADVDDDGLDRGLVLAVLALVCAGSMERRKRLAFDALASSSSDGKKGSVQEISMARAVLYIRKLRAIYLLPSSSSEECRARDGDHGGGDDDEGIDRKENGSASSCSIGFPRFVAMLDNPDRGLGIVSLLAKLEAGSRSRHNRWHACSVCCYPIDGPRFREMALGFSLCALCYSSGKVPSGVDHKQHYYFKEFDSDLDALVDKFQVFRSPFAAVKH